MRIKTKTFLSITILLMGLTLVPLFFIKAGTGVSLYLSPSESNYKVGDLINVSVMVNTGDETINAIKATLNFSENLEVQNVSKSGSIFGLWAEDPSYDNTAKTISFGGAGAGTTYKGSAGKLISVTLKTKKAGEGKIEFGSSIVKYGATTIGVNSSAGGIYTINVPCICSSWQSKGCGEGDCSSIQQLQTKTCTPSGCGIESRCVEDSSCIKTPLIEKEETIEESAPKSEEIIGESVEEIVISAKQSAEEKIGPTEEKRIQEGLLASLAMVWGGTSQLATIIMITILCLTALIFIGIKEWMLLQKKKQ